MGRDSGAAGTILQEAERLTSQDRNSVYGHPFYDFSRTGQMWAAILGVESVTPEQVALCMIALKMSRLCMTAAHHDTLVDIAGYARTYEMVREERKRMEYEACPAFEHVDSPATASSERT